MELEDVGKGYYCEYIEHGLGFCAATKRTSCVGCKARHRKFKSRKWVTHYYYPEKG
jgi:hypothetical protein